LKSFKNYREKEDMTPNFKANSYNFMIYPRQVKATFYGTINYKLMLGETIAITTC